MQQLQPNTTLQGGKYRIERVLGQGGFGITYLATQVSLNRYVAIKELFIGGRGQAINDREGDNVIVTNSANQDCFEQQRDKFKKEAQRLANLSHPNLVNVHELFEENGTAYFVMDYIDGESLRTKLNRDGCLTENQVLKYVKQLLPALEVAHKQNIWHLDIKPENIMVDKSDHVYLIDFGASKHIEQNSTLTTSLALAYTPGYCPPELADLNSGSFDNYIQALEDIGPWTDIYALGAAMYNLLTDNNPPTSTRLFREGRKAFLFTDKVSTSTQELIVLMMNPDQQKRPHSIAELQSKMDVGRDEGTIAESPVAPVCPSPKPAPPKPASSRPTTPNASNSNTHNLTSIFVAAVGIVAIIVLLLYIKNYRPSQSLEKSIDSVERVGNTNTFSDYLDAADAGDPVAQNKVGNMYAKGEGCKKNSSKAAKYYRMAAEQGNKYAQHNLGFCYWDGNGVSRDREEAIYWLRLSANQGYKPAQKFLSNNGIDY